MQSDSEHLPTNSEASSNFRARLRGRYDRFQARYGKWMGPFFFILGFVFDAVVIKRPDEIAALVQQVLYIGIAAGLIAVDLIELIGHERPVAVPRWLARVWSLREFLLQFMFGTLLNVYTIFYFKSASALTSFGFIGFMAILLVVHEFRKFGNYQTQVHVGLLSLCVVSFFGLLAPIALGYVGPIPFFIANLLAWFSMVMYRKILEGRLHLDRPQIRRRVVVPFAVVQVTFVALYIFRVLPPVPLSMSYMGIFHAAVKEGADYKLTYTRPEEYFWQNGDQTFYARPGDAVICFFRVFAPTRFKDELKVRWLFDDPVRGWTSADAIALTIKGGREEGYRGIAKKNNYQPGAWRVQIETDDGREVGRINFTIVSDSEAAPRLEKSIVQ